MDRDEARAALDGKDDITRKYATEGPEYPAWRYAAFGLMMALIVLSQGFGSALKAALFLTAMAMLVWMLRDDRRRYGVFVNGYRKGRTLPLTIALVGFLLLAMGAELYAYANDWTIAPKLAIAGAVFAVATLASVWWNRIYERELLEGDA